jgi:hypothetical protein
MSTKAERIEALEAEVAYLRAQVAGWAARVAAIEASNGYTCPSCGCWYARGTVHSCAGRQWPYIWTVSNSTAQAS